MFDNVDDARFLVEPPVAVGSESRKRRIEYLPVCEHGFILITTRSMDEALKLVYEGNAINILPMDDGHAETLLQRKLASKGNEGNRMRLAAALDFIPLAMTQAAAYIRRRGTGCSVQQYIERLESSRSSRISLLGRESQRDIGRDGEASSSVLVTWQISFEQICQIRQSAADLLSRMSFCDRQAIPERLLCNKPETHDTGMDEDGNFDKNTIEFDEDISVLQSYSFISESSETRSWDLHRLVQDATQMWLEQNGQLERNYADFLHHLCETFPSAAYKNWQECRVLFPHAKATAERMPQITWREAVLDWASIMYNAAWYACEMGNSTDAEVMARKSMKVRQRELEEENRDTIYSAAMLMDALNLVTGGKRQRFCNPA